VRHGSGGLSNEKTHLPGGAATGAAGLATGIQPTAALEHVGDRRTLVFSGGQPVPCSIRM